MKNPRFRKSRAKIAAAGKVKRAKVQEAANLQEDSHSVRFLRERPF